MFHRKNALDQMMRTCKDSNLAIKRLQVKHEDNEENRYYASLRLHVPWNTHMDELEGQIRKIDGIESVRWAEVKE